MTFPVIVHPIHGQFEAALVGAPDVCATAPTREEALAGLESAIAKRLEQGELIALDVRRRGLAGLYGKYREDPTLREICEAADQERDSDVREFAELAREQRITGPQKFDALFGAGADLWDDDPDFARFMQALKESRRTGD